MWIWAQMNVTKLCWWLVSIGSGNGLVLLGTKPVPEPVLTKVCWHIASLGLNYLIKHWTFSIKKNEAKFISVKQKSQQ